MTRIFLITGIVLSALAVGVPAAVGMVQPVEDGAGAQFTTVSRPDSHDLLPATGVGYLDAHERAALARDRADGFVRGDDFVRIDPADLPTVTIQATSSGRDVEWPQIGIGFGVGLLLAVGLLMAMRATRIRPLAH